MTARMKTPVPIYQVVSTDGDGGFTPLCQIDPQEAKRIHHSEPNRLRIWRKLRTLPHGWTAFPYGMLKMKWRSG